MLTSLFVGKLVRRYGTHKIIWLGAIIIVLSSVAMVGCSIILPHSLYGFVGSMMGYAAGFGLAGSPLAKETLSASPHGGGFAAAMLGFSMTGFSSLASIIVSALYNQTIFRSRNYLNHCFSGLIHHFLYPGSSNISISKYKPQSLFWFCYASIQSSVWRLI